MKAQSWIVEFPFKDPDSDKIEEVHNRLGTLDIEEGAKYVDKLQNFSDVKPSSVFLTFRDNQNKMNIKFLVDYSELLEMIKKLDKS